MQIKQGFLSGYKTHIVTAFGVLTVALAWSVGELETKEAIMCVFGGGYASTFREALKTMTAGQGK